MKQTYIEERAMRVVKELLGLDVDPRTDKSLTDLGADSLDVIEVEMALEQEFECEFETESQIDMNTTIGGIVARIKLLHPEPQA